MSRHYQRVMEVLRKWPLDKSKGTRDYGLHLRNLVKVAFPAGDVFPGTEDEKIEKYEALLRLTKNKYKEMYSSHQNLGATGLTKDQLHHSLSKEFVEKFLK